MNTRHFVKSVLRGTGQNAHGAVHSFLSRAKAEALLAKLANDKRLEAHDLGSRETEW